MKFYGFIPDGYNESAILLDVQLRKNDLLFGYKKRLFDANFLKISKGLNTYGVRADTPRFPIELQKLITPFRLRSYALSERYLELVRLNPLFN